MVVKASCCMFLITLVAVISLSKSEFLQEIDKCPKGFYQFEVKSENFVSCCPCQSCANEKPTTLLPRKLKCVQDDRTKSCSQYDTTKCCKLSDCYAIMGQPMSLSELCRLNCDKNALCDVKNRLVSCRCMIGYKGSGRTCRKVKSKDLNEQQTFDQNQLPDLKSPQNSQVATHTTVPALYIIIGCAAFLLFTIFIMLLCLHWKKTSIKYCKTRLTNRNSEEIIETGVVSESVEPLNTGQVENRQNEVDEGDCSYSTVTPPLSQLRHNEEPRQATIQSQGGDTVNVTGDYLKIFGNVTIHKHHHPSSNHQHRGEPPAYQEDVSRPRKYEIGDDSDDDMKSCGETSNNFARNRPPLRRTNLHVDDQSLIDQSFPSTYRPNRDFSSSTDTDASYY